MYTHSFHDTNVSHYTFRPCLPPKSTWSRNHVHKGKKALELSKIDQANLRLKLKQRKQGPNASHYFRPYIMIDAPQLPQTYKKQASQEVSRGIQEVTNAMNWQKPTLNAPRHSFGSTKQIGKVPLTKIWQKHQYDWCHIQNKIWLGTVFCSLVPRPRPAFRRL